MTRAEIEIIAEVAAERAVKRTLLAVGIDANDPQSVIDHQEDAHFVRRWRESTEEVKRKGLLTLVGLFVSGLVGYLWLAFRGH